mmetsp:Transcript_94180/g.177168  ORF Transcript_94180/g.177168 Transcript_94180/m.177168 type:complete len:91 (-) Transcript_94180:81-353(-)
MHPLAVSTTSILPEVVYQIDLRSSVPQVQFELALMCTDELGAAVRPRERSAAKVTRGEVHYVQQWTFFYGSWRGRCSGCVIATSVSLLCE